ncbi:MAG: hypothetical protein EA351_10145 [Gemmatimonadales bacterium]|nr:MAG: hypothetical protein EA351_10145 [Gemmatimonadales bacterium]
MPLSLQWIMMALEHPFLAAVIARLADPTFNLAAYGVAFAFAILVESPVIMLMSASTALVEDARSYLKMRAFAWALNLLSTGLLILFLIPAVFSFFTHTLLALPDQVSTLVYGSLWILLPWPAAIGYRRFVHGILIRSGRTRRVAYGTGLRLGTMALTGLGLAAAGLPGAWVGAGALSAGVVIEACAAWVMSRDVIRVIVEDDRDPASLQGHAVPGRTPAARSVRVGEGPARAREAVSRREEGVGATSDAGSPATGAASARRGPGPVDGPLDYRTIAAFYYPLALTSFIGLTTQPLLTFFMGRAPAPVESLAVFPVVMALYFLFATFGLSYQEASIALVGRRGEHRGPMGRFAVGLALAASGGLAILAFTPLARVWFEGISGLTPELAALAFVPAQIVALGPALSVLTGFQRALLVQARRTRPITLATILEVGIIASLFPLLGWGMGWMGVTAAMGALIAGRVGSVLFLYSRVRTLYD